MKRRFQHCVLHSDMSFPLRAVAKDFFGNVAGLLPILRQCTGSGNLNPRVSNRGSFALVSIGSIGPHCAKRINSRQGIERSAFEKSTL